MTTLPQTTPMRLPRPAGGATAVAPVMGPQVAAGVGGMTADDIWRVIRANLWLIMTILCASLIIGYVVNRVLERYMPRYSATGMVSIHAPTSYNYQTRMNDPLSDFPGLTVEQRTQSMLIRNDSLFTKVLQNPASPVRNTKWFHSFEVPVAQADGSTRTVLDLAAAKRSLDDSFTTASLDGTNVVTATMTCADGRDARDIVQAIIEAHLESQDQLIVDREFEKSDTLKQVHEAQKTKIKELQDAMHAKALDLNIEGTDRSNKLTTRQNELEKLVDERFLLQNHLANAKTNSDAINEQLSNGLEPQQISDAVSQDPDVRHFRDEVLDDEIKLSTNLHEGPESNERKDIEAHRTAMANKLEESRSLAQTNARTKLTTDLQSTVAGDTQELTILNKRIDTARDELSGLSNAMVDYNQISDELAKIRDESQETQQQIDALNSQIQQSSHGVMWAEKPIVPDLPSFPKMPYTMGITVILGLMLSLGIAFIREILDTSVRSPRDITRVGNLTLLGMIPHEDDDPQSHGVPLPFVIYQAPTSIMAEGFRQVRTRLQHAASLDTTRTILVTSPSPGDGKSVVAANLAAGLALNGRHILLVDANFRRPILDKNFSVDNTLGLSEVLTGGIDRFDSAVHRTVVPNLSVMPSGPRPNNATELLEGRILLDFIDRALEEYDHVIFDSGPMLLVSETAALAPRVDGVVTVVRARTNSRGVLQRLRDNLRQLKAEHLGVVLNAVRSQGGGYYGRNIKTYYEYQNAG